MNLASALEAGRRDFLESIENLPPAQASTRPAPESWSVLECVEHVVTAESRFLGWIANGKPIAAERDTDKELRILTTARSRLNKREAPEPVRPSGRFKDLSAALAEFESVRDRTVQIARERGDELYSIGAKHPFFGDINAIELLYLIDGHAR